MLFNIESLISHFWQFVVILIIAAGAAASVLLIQSMRKVRQRNDREDKSAVDNKSVAKKETSIMREEKEIDRPSIKIIREQYFFSYKNLRIAEVQHKLDIYRPKERKYLAYYSEEYRSQFQAKLHDGTGLQIVPVWELPYILNEGVSAEGEMITIDDVIKKFSSVLGISEEEVYKVVAIILLPKRGELTREGYYEQIVVSWLDKREPEITEKKERVDKVTVAVGGKASSYVDVHLAEKYQFESPPYPDTINNKKINKNEDYTIILDDKRHYIFRFRRGLSGQVIINCKIGLEKMLLTWILLGFIVGIGTIAFSIWSALYGDAFAHITPIILGTLAVLVGFRILLFEDIDLLEKWSWIYVILIISNAAILTCIGAIEVFSQKQEEVVGLLILILSVYKL